MLPLHRSQRASEVGNTPSSGISSHDVQSDSRRSLSQQLIPPYVNGRQFFAQQGAVKMSRGNHTFVQSHSLQCTGGTCSFKDPVAHSFVT